MEKTLMFRSASEVRLSRVLRFMIPTYLTSLFNTVYTMVDGIFVSAYVGTNALAAINIVYPIVNVLTGIALAFATGGSSIPASGRRTERSGQPYVYDQCAGLYPAWVRGLATRLDQPVCHIDSAGRNTDHDGGLPNLCVLVAHRHAGCHWKRAVHLFYPRGRQPNIQFPDRTSGWYFKYHSGLCVCRTDADGHSGRVTGDYSGTMSVVCYGCALFCRAIRCAAADPTRPVGTHWTVLHGQRCVGVHQPAGHRYHDHRLQSHCHGVCRRGRHCSRVHHHVLAVFVHRYLLRFFHGPSASAGLCVRRSQI